MTESPGQGLPFFTIGHATHPIAEFVALLQAAGATQLVDVRSFPRSRTNPQFNKDILPGALAEYGIGYVHLAGLGGRRSLQRNIDPQTNGFWDNRSFHNYADYALQPAFGTALAELIAMGQRQRCAIMCAESVWWRCHRRIIADHLLARGKMVRHILPTQTTEAKLTAGAVVHEDGQVTYPSPTRDLWEPPTP